MYDNDKNEISIAEALRTTLELATLLDEKSDDDVLVVNKMNSIGDAERSTVPAPYVVLVRNKHNELKIVVKDEAWYKTTYNNGYEMSYEKFLDSFPVYKGLSVLKIKQIYCNKQEDRLDEQGYLGAKTYCDRYYGGFLASIEPYRNKLYLNETLLEELGEDALSINMMRRILDLKVDSFNNYMEEGSNA